MKPDEMEELLMIILISLAGGVFFLPWLVNRKNSINENEN
jgi:hypothetical protein